jgi:hypothetical protein
MNIYLIDAWHLYKRFPNETYFKYLQVATKVLIV